MQPTCMRLDLGRRRCFAHAFNIVHIIITCIFICFHRIFMCIYYTEQHRRIIIFHHIIENKKRLKVKQ
jgi:hypothetical protein